MFDADRPLARTFLFLLTLLVTPWPLLARSHGNQFPDTKVLQGVSVRYDFSANIAWYSPQFDPWAIPQFKVYPVCGRKSVGKNVLHLVGFVKTERPAGLKSLEVSVEGVSKRLVIKRSDVDVDTSGCLVAQRVEIRDEGELVRSIAAARNVVVLFNGVRSENRYGLTSKDLDDFRHIVSICDTENLSEAKEEQGSGPDVVIGEKAGTEGVSNPVLLRDTRRDPVFPEVAIRRQRQGSVTLQAVVLKDGIVGNVQVLKSSTHDCGFEESAIAAVRTWRYKPGSKDGVPVDVYFTVVVDFYWGR